MRSSRSENRLRAAAGGVTTVVLVLGSIAGCGGKRSRSRGPGRSEELAPSATRAQRPHRITIGRSVLGRRIDAIALGGPSATGTVLVIGCIHGNEPAGIAIARSLVEHGPTSGSALWVVPVLNPDGAAAGRRQNADGVDLNRNFPWHWRAVGLRGDPQYSGPRALSEPEARAARRLILRLRPRITIWFHQPLGLVDLSGGDAHIERRYARLAGLPLRRLTRYPGSAVNWSNSTVPGTTAFVVELPPGSLSAASVGRYTRAVLAVAQAPGSR